MTACLRNTLPESRRRIETFLSLRWACGGESGRLAKGSMEPGNSFSKRILTSDRRGVLGKSDWQNAAPWC
ncbi:protein of unknown function [Candidatus Filomicrobium marinum]|uniref:Uncharacterized protein n=1 Tax=Candidatus Filomicrobium marinum TaxID=1608628 RepID=A0A0D6JJP2_9HYPH|nr:protein of unknown function [Candidatus Filomicrobium marinum]